MIKLILSYASFTSLFAILILCLFSETEEIGIFIALRAIAILILYILYKFPYKILLEEIIDDLN